MRFSKSLAIFAASLSVVGAAHAAVLSLHAIDNVTARVLIEGEIKSGDAIQLQSLLESSRTATLKITVVSLNSRGGSLLEAIKLVDEIKRARLATEVENDNICASACFLAFAAGATKTANAAARIGVHGAADIKDQQTSNAAQATILMARLAIKTLGVPSEIIGKMVTTPPNDIVWLSNSELQSMDVRILDGTQSSNRRFLPADDFVIGDQKASQNWSELVATALAVSRLQNGGIVQANRTCEPLSGACEWSIDFRLTDGRRAVLLTTQDRGGQTISRKYCQTEPSGDLRHCIDWNTRNRSDERKNADGAWANAN